MRIAPSLRIRRYLQPTPQNQPNPAGLQVMESTVETFSVVWRGLAPGCSGLWRAEYPRLSFLPPLEEERTIPNPAPPQASASSRSVTAISGSIKQPTRMGLEP